LAPEVWHGRGCACGRRAARAWFPTPFARSKELEISGYRHWPRPPLACCVRRPAKIAARLAGLTSSCCRTIPGAGVTGRRRSCAADQSGPGQAFPWPGPRSSTPAIPALVRPGSIALRTSANRSRQSAFLQQGLKLPMERTPAPYASIRATPTLLLSTFPRVPLAALRGPRLSELAQRFWEAHSTTGALVLYELGAGLTGDRSLAPFA